MTSTLLRVGWITLKRDRVALFLTFALPIVFFTIFGSIFANMGGGSGAESIDLAVLVVDEDDTEVSRKLIAALAAHEAVTVSPRRESVESGGTAAGAASRWTRDSAHKAVRQGEADAAVVVSEGLGAEFGNFAGAAPKVEIIYDASNPMAQATVAGLLHAASFQSSPALLMEKGLGMLEGFGGGLTPEQRQALEAMKPLVEVGGSMGGGSGAGGLIDVEATAAHDSGDGEAGEEGGGDETAIVAYYAAGIGVMFLLFSMTGAAGGLLEEQERGTLERLLTSNVGMPALLGSRWLFFTVMGLVQVCLMFVWGWAVFGLDLWSVKRIVGLLAMALVTSAAAASFGLVLAAACRSRAQLGGLSTIVILVMSALGGSMVPRFAMPDFMNSVAKLTLNGWALDGFLKVFWYDDPEAGALEALWGLAPQLAVLASLAAVFFVAARALGRRWETI